MWNFFTAHVSDVVYGVPSFSSFVDAMITSWSSAEHLALLQSFLTGADAVQLGEAELDVWNRAIANVQSNIQWMNANKADIVAWLNQNGFAASS